MDGPGTVTWEEFLENAGNLVRLSDEMSDGWELRGEKSIPCQAYLYRRVKTFVPGDYLEDSFSSNVKHHEIKEDDENLDPPAIDDPYEAKSETEQPLVMEHHVLWNMSYGVPTIYFNAWFSDFPGVNRIGVAEAQKIVPQGALDYNELSQAIHPILGTTFLHLHPCKSQEILSKMTKSNNKLVSWLSVVAPAALNLNINPKYFELTKHSDEKV